MDDSDYSDDYRYFLQQLEQEFDQNQYHFYGQYSDDQDDWLQWLQGNQTTKKKSPYTYQESQRAINYRKQSNLFQTACRRRTKVTKERHKSDIKNSQRLNKRMGITWSAQEDQPTLINQSIRQFPQLSTKTTDKPLWMKMAENRTKSLSQKEEQKIQKYLNDGQEVTQELILAKNIQTEVRRLKKILHLSISDIKDIKLFYGRTYPIIFFSYQKDRKLKYKFIREFVRQNQEIIKEDTTFIENIFQKLYMKVSLEYHRIYEFGIQNGKKFHIYVKRQHLHIKGRSKEDLLLFYGITSKGLIQFILFNRYLQYLRFSSDDIEKIKKSSLSKKFVTAIKHYDNFLKVAYKSHETEKKYKMLEGQQVSDSQSSQSQNQQAQLSLSQKRLLLDMLIKRDMSNYEDSLMEMKAQYSKGSKSGKNQNTSSKSQLFHLRKLHQRIQAFKQERQTIEKKLMSANDHTQLIINSYLKKLQLLESQLQSQLPIINYKRQIFSHLDKNQILLLEGETGSGKSTQLPLILSQYFGLFENSKCHPIVITEPRKIAVRNLAQRVAFQLCEKVGQFVDYKASNDNKKITNKSKIIFKLDRLLLDELIDDPLLQKYSCLMIDEAHERTVSIDIILGYISNILKQRKNFKIVISSASMDIDLFQKYFKSTALKVYGRQHNVDVIYKPFNQGNHLQKIIKILNSQIIKNDNQLFQNYKGHILVFCNQIDEINQLCKYFKMKLNKHMFKVLPLHSKITPHQQKEIFLPSRQFKLIFATNIAQTAITINGIKVVIDPGLSKDKLFDPEHSIYQTIIQQISQSSARQRSGRAGRTSSGYCFRLYSQEEFYSRSYSNRPQIENTSLDIFMLRIISLNIQDVYSFQFITKPVERAINSAIQTLKMIGAINQNSKIKAQGKLLVKIPMEPIVSRSIIEGLFFNQILKDKGKMKQICAQWNTKQKQKLENFNVCSQIALILSMMTYYDDIFNENFKERAIGKFLKQDQLFQGEGDLTFLLNLYHKYQRTREDQTQCRQFLKLHFLNNKALKDVDQTHSQIMKIIKSSKIRFNKFPQQLQNSYKKIRSCKNVNEIILACLLSSLCANLCLYSGNPNIGYTLISKRKPIHIDKLSTLSIAESYPQWIVCYDFFTNQKGHFYCKLAQKIEYDFVLSTIEPYILDKYAIATINKINPFYRKLKYPLSTKIINQIKQDFSLKQQQKKLEFMSNIQVAINQASNEIQFYILDEESQKINDQSIESKSQSEINIYIGTLFQQMKQNYMHHYFGHIYAIFSDGFQMKQLLLNNNEIIIQIKEIMDSNTHNLLIQVLDDNIDYFQKLENINENIVITIQRKRNKIFVEHILNKLLEIMPKSFKYEQIIIDRRRKIPQHKIELHFFTGQSTSDSLYLWYLKGKKVVQDMLPNLQLAVLKKMVKNRDFILNDTNFKMNKAQTGINYIDTDIDEYDFVQAIKELQAEELFEFNFKMPDQIKRFREPTLLSLKSNQQWKKDINKLLIQVSISPSICTVQVWGNQFDKQGVQNARLQMHASITSFDPQLGIKMKTYDGQNVLGSEKVHIYQKYQQTIAFCNKEVFNNMYDDIFKVIHQFKQKNARLEFQIKNKRIKRQDKVMIICRCTSKKDLQKPFKIISSMLRPKIIELSQFQYHYFSTISFGKIFMKEIEKEFNFSLFICLNESTHLLQVYCRKKQFSKIQSMIKEQTKRINKGMHAISYKGKNLQEIIQVLQQWKTNNSKKFVYFKVNYNTRQIVIFSSLDTFEQLINQISKINSKKTVGNCDICFNSMISPYRLFNCKHEFCRNCLSNQIKQQKSHHLIKCPQQDCQKYINIHDLKELVEEEQFNKICDLFIKAYAEKNRSKYVLCRNCQQIYNGQQLKNLTQLQCQNCEYTFCLKCFDAHPGSKCKPEISDQTLMALGIKKCPNCNYGLSKNKGCNHIECLNCHSHICWVCSGIFNKISIYDHLKIAHGSFGIQL